LGQGTDQVRGEAEIVEPPPQYLNNAGISFSNVERRIKAAARAMGCQHGGR
jgi:hypothetical protein